MILPNILVTKVSIETGNFLFWYDIPTTLNAMFANDISSAFMIDLLFVVMVFLIWSYKESERLNMKRSWTLWLLTFLFGLAGAFPLFMYEREKALEVKKVSPIENP